jgi:acyl-CoA thioesterase FadM
MTHKTFRVNRRVYRGDTDMATIMNMPRAFDFANAAIEDFYYAVVRIGFLNIIYERGLGVPYVHAS